MKNKIIFSNWIECEMPSVTFVRPERVKRNVYGVLYIQGTQPILHTAGTLLLKCFNNMDK